MAELHSWSILILMGSFINHNIHLNQERKPAGCEIHNLSIEICKISFTTRDIHPQAELIATWCEVQEQVKMMIVTHHFHGELNHTIHLQQELTALCYEIQVLANLTITPPH
jgi:hypothetical protein